MDNEYFTSWQHQLCERAYSGIIEPQSSKESVLESVLILTWLIREGFVEATREEDLLWEWVMMPISTGRFRGLETLRKPLFELCKVCKKCNLALSLILEFSSDPEFHTEATEAALAFVQELTAIESGQCIWYLESICRCPSSFDLKLVQKVINKLQTQLT